MTPNLRSSARSVALAVAAALTVTLPTLAQGAPGTDIHLAALTLRDSGVVVGTPVNITGRPGYDNQPSFTSMGGR